MGIIATLKIIAPLSLYLGGICAMLCSIVGRVYITLTFIVFLLPLRNVIEKIQQFPAGSQFLDMLYASMLLGWLISSGSSVKSNKTPSYITIPAICMCIYLFFSLIIGTNSLYGSFGIDPHESRVQDWKNFTLMPVLFFLVVNNLPDKKWVWRVFWSMMGALVLVCYYTVSQVTEYTSLLSRVKISGTFQFLGPNEVAAFLNQTAIILSGICFCIKRSWVKTFLVAMVITFIYCIIFLYSRGAYLGLCAGLFILFAFKNRLLLVPLILILALWQVVLPAKVIERIQGTTNEYGELDESSELRIVMWEKGMELFRSSPVVGIGYGVFRLMDFGTGLHDTHNIYVKILVEQGVIGFILFFVLVFAFIRQGYDLYQKGFDDMSKGLGLGLGVSMITLLINNFFGDRWAYFELSAYTWVFAGLVTRLCQLADAAPPEEVKTETVPVSVSQEPRVKAAPKVPGRKPRKSYYK